MNLSMKWIKKPNLMNLVWMRFIFNPSSFRSDFRSCWLLRVNLKTPFYASTFASLSCFPNSLPFFLLFCSVLDCYLYNLRDRNLKSSIYIYISFLVQKNYLLPQHNLVIAFVFSPRTFQFLCTCLQPFLLLFFWFQNLFRQEVNDASFICVFFLTPHLFCLIRETVGKAALRSFASKTILLLMGVTYFSVSAAMFWYTLTLVIMSINIQEFQIM
jgi:hypothetical protein